MPYFSGMYVNSRKKKSVYIVDLFGFEVFCICASLVYLSLKDVGEISVDFRNIVSIDLIGDLCSVGCLCSILSDWSSSCFVTNIDNLG